MNKKFKFRAWMFLEEAAERLSNQLGEPFGETDMLALLSEGTLPMYWYLHNHPAAQTAPLTLFYNHGYHRKDAFLDFLPSPRHSIDELSGPYRLVANDLPGLNQDIITNIHNKLFNKPFFTPAYEAYVVDNEGSWWRLLRRAGSEDGDALAPKGYSSSVRYPKLSEIVVLVSDVEALLQADEETSHLEAAIGATTAKATEQRDHPAKNPDHPCYAPELHAAIEVWESLYLNGKKPEHLDHTTAVKAWFKDNWSELSATAITKRLAPVTNTKSNKNSGRFQEK
ncbi:hypothetical protein SAMN05660479_01477 [Microbulbifer thermotolerans]|uniref:hypothetical protein n=1 Tax=Microbulbifer thermotolerans TaxID=252514 RepID=UPI0008EB13D0|nr:hypothetical protein [Microbulbifer thermotolerans]SFC31772.1 hypothetical protein SAMN05660479_01477 [Microbulbifer thermotolerans]